MNRSLIWPLALCITLAISRWTVAQPTPASSGPPSYRTAAANPSPATDPLAPIDRLALGWFRGRSFDGFFGQRGGGGYDYADPGPQHPWAAQAPWGYEGPEIGQPMGAPMGEPIFDPESGAVIVDEGFGAYGGQGGYGCEPARGRPPGWLHRSTIFGDYLYLRPRDAELVYASPVDGPVTPPGNPANPGNQVGPLGMLDPEYNSAYRVGFWWAYSDCTSIGAAFTRFDSSTSDQIEAAPGDFIKSLVTHPGVLNARDNWQIGRAQLDIDFDLLDVDYRLLLAHGDLYGVNLVAGPRLARLEENFHSEFLINGSRTLDTQVDFEGAGILLGFDATRYAPCSGFLVYGKGSASFLAGEINADYRQSSAFASPEIMTSWEAGRVVTVLEMELGVGWRSRCDRVRISAGYLFMAWLNTLATDEWIAAVNANSFAGLGGDEITFDGLVAHAEWRF